MMNEPYSTPRAIQGHLVPEGGALVGYSALIQAFGLAVPLRRPACTVDRYIKGRHRMEGVWRIFDKDFRPADTLAGHLAFAFRNEDMDLLVLSRLFEHVSPDDILAVVITSPTGPLMRRIWFFYEWITGRRLDLNDASQGNYVDALDKKKYLTANPIKSPRHRVRDNLLGVSGFCATVRRTSELESVISEKLDEKARSLVGRVNAGVLARASSFMLLADSQASYEIEGERPSSSRLQRWGQAVSQAGKAPISIDEIVRLQNIVISDERFTHSGIRKEGVFLGQRETGGSPVPEFIGAPEKDLEGLLDALVCADHRLGQGGVDPVAHAAILAFGLVFIHPFEDGNGRVHRCLVHHVFNERKYTPAGMIFPVSSVMRDDMESYGRVLKSHSGPLMSFIEWEPTKNLNVRVLNETRDLYAYWDATDIVIYLYQCVKRTVDEVLPEEISYLESFDTAKAKINEIIEMPDNKVSLLINMIRQNAGALGKKRHAKEFALLSDGEAAEIEEIVRQCFHLNVTA